MRGAAEGCFVREERRPMGSSKKGWKTAATSARENEVDAKGPSAMQAEELQKKSGPGGRHSDERDLGRGHIRWSEVSAFEDGDMKRRCLHASRKLCSKVREDWGKSRDDTEII